MKVELHLHTNRYSTCAVDSPEDMMARLVELGYDAVFITEHDAVWSEAELDDLRSKFPSLKIFPGLEITLANAVRSVHLLILGTRDPAFLTMQRDVGSILARARRQHCLTVLAHPYRWEGGSGILAEGFYPDAIEHRTPNHTPLQSLMSKVTARQRSLRLINSGDCHSLNFPGYFWVETHQPFDSPAELRRIILEGQYENRTYEDESLTTGTGNQELGTGEKQEPVKREPGKNRNQEPGETGTGNNKKQG
ncbi:MAG: PHP domain-containing protein [Phycisphaerae bacterium]|nr:PHP domain-containing protein [Phycisphaerae bacterium]